jgi:hypothetical protein
VHRASLEQLKQDDRIFVTLEVVVDRITEHENGDRSVVGHLVGEEDSFAVFTRTTPHLLVWRNGDKPQP